MIAELIFKTKCNPQFSLILYLKQEMCLTQLFRKIVSYFERSPIQTQPQEELITLNSDPIKTSFFHQELQKLYTECFKFTDFNLVSSSGVKIPCHKIVLALRCEFFFEMFKNVSEYSTNEPLVLSGANTQDLQAFIDYIYTDQVSQNSATIGLLTLADKFLMEDLKTKCLGGMVNEINLETASEILQIFDDFNSRNLLTGELSWKLKDVMKFTIENCMDIFLVGHQHDLAVLKINALYFIKENWNEIEHSEKFKKMKANHQDSISVINQYLGYNDPKNPVLIPYKIILSRDKNNGIFGYTYKYSNNWKSALILKTKKDKPAGLHGGMKAGNLILSVENKSLENISGYKDHQSIMEDFKHKPYVTFELNIAMSEDILVLEEIVITKQLP